MTDEESKEEDVASQNENTDRIRTGTPRKSKAKELILMEEFCVFCYGSPSSNDEDFEELLRCSECLKYAHPSCLEMPVTAIENTKLYDWQCNDCKGCFQCKKKTKEKCIILCDYCDRGFHTFCLEKRPTQAEKTSWKCPFCGDANIGKDKHSINNKPACLLSMKESSPETVCDKTDEKVVAEQTVILSTPEPILGKFLIESERGKLSLEKEDSPKKKEGVAKTGDKQEKIEQDDGFTEILHSTVQGNEKSKSEKSMQAGNKEKRIKRGGLRGDTSIQKTSDVVTSMNFTKLESVDGEEKSSKNIETREKLLRRFSQRLCTSTVHVSLDDIIEKDDKIHARTTDDVFRRKRVRGDSLKISKNTLNKRRSSRLSFPSVGNSIVQITNIKKENMLDNKANLGTDSSEKDFASQDESRSSKRVKLVGKRRHSMIEKAIKEEDVSEDVPLISYSKAFSALKVGKEKLKRKTDEESGKAKPDEGGETNGVDNTIPIKKKRGRPRKYPLKQENPPKEEKEIIHSDSDKNTRDKAVKLVSHSRTRELRASSTKESKVKVEVSISKEEEENRRVLRKTSREPTISPTKARSILTGKKIDKVHPLGSELGKSPSEKKASGSVKSKSPLMKVEKSPTKYSVQKMRKSTERITPKATPPSNKETKRSSTTRSDREKSGSKLSGRRKEEKSKNKVNNESVSKRKLSFEEKSKDIKKAKTSLEGKQDSEVNQRPKRRSMASSKEEQSKEEQDNDIRDFVSMEDTALFEEAQKMLKEDDKIRDTSKIIEQGIRTVHFGEYEIDPWYSSPYPSEFKLLGEVFICEYCLKYMKSATILRRHMAKCAWRHPPGDEIYRKDKISVFEVDGEKSSTYCQNLCLFAKLFLDHKTLYYEVEPFLFYVMTLVDCSGCHMVGYFSKEKVSFLNYNVSCILVLPHCMRKGYGKALIDFSYLLSRVEGKVGSPERPLSDLGLISYRSYWKDVLLRYLTTLEDDRVSIKEMSQKTSIMSNDLISTMQYLGILKYWKGKHVITVQQEMLDMYAAKSKSNRKFKLTLEESGLSWTPKDYGNGKNRSKIS